MHGDLYYTRLQAEAREAAAQAAPHPIDSAAFAYHTSRAKAFAEAADLYRTMRMKGSPND